MPTASVTTPTRIRPAPHPFSAGAIARRANEASYVHGLEAGHADGIAHLRQLILEARVAHNAARRQAADYGPEDPARARLDAVAAVHRAHIRTMAAAVRALDEGGPA